MRQHTCRVDSPVVTTVLGRSPVMPHVTVDVRVDSSYLSTSYSKFAASSSSILDLTISIPGVLGTGTQRGLVSSERLCCSQRKSLVKSTQQL